MQHTYKCFVRFAILFIKKLLRTNPPPISYVFWTFGHSNYVFYRDFIAILIIQSLYTAWILQREGVELKKEVFNVILEREYFSAYLIE